VSRLLALSFATIVLASGCKPTGVIDTNDGNPDDTDVNEETGKTGIETGEDTNDTKPDETGDGPVETGDSPVDSGRDSGFPWPDSGFPWPDSGFPWPDSGFPWPDSGFPWPDSGWWPWPDSGSWWDTGGWWDTGSSGGDSGIDSTRTFTIGTSGTWKSSKYTGADTYNEYNASTGSALCSYSWSTVTGSKTTVSGCADLDGNACDFAFDVTRTKGSGTCSTEPDPAKAIQAYGYMDSFQYYGYDLGPAAMIYIDSKSYTGWTFAALPDYSSSYGSVSYASSTGAFKFTSAQFYYLYY